MPYPGSSDRGGPAVKRQTFERELEAGENQSAHRGYQIRTSGGRIDIHVAAGRPVLRAPRNGRRIQIAHRRLDGCRPAVTHHLDGQRRKCLERNRRGPIDNRTSPPAVQLLDFNDSISNASTQLNVGRARNKVRRGQRAILHRQQQIRGHRLQGSSNGPCQRHRSTGLHGDARRQEPSHGPQVCVCFEVEIACLGSGRNRKLTPHQQ
jgi:hypothetical protein